MYRTGWALLLLLVLPQMAGAQAFVERVYPPSLERGRVSRIVVVGKHLQGATALWTSLGKQIQSQPAGVSTGTEALFDVYVPDTSPLGLYGLRLATRDGLSNVHLFAIDDLPPRLEQEYQANGPTNNARTKAQPVELPAALAGSCGPTDIDCFAIQVEAGQRISFEVVGSRLGKAFDPVLTILTEEGRFVTERDNDVGLFFDCRFEHRFTKAGRYIVQLRDSRYHGSHHWTYVLRMGRFPTARVALPSTLKQGADAKVRFPQLGGPAQTVNVRTRLGDRFFFGLRRSDDDGSAWLPMEFSTLRNQIEQEPNGTPEQGTLAQVPVNLHGVIDRANDVDYFSLQLKKGQKLKLRSETRGMGSPADLELAIYNAKGEQLRQVDDSGFEDATFSFTAPADGRYQLRVVDVVGQGGSAYAYRIEIRERQPAIKLQSEIGRIAIPQGTWQPLLLQLSRVDYQGPVALALVGAPEGLHLREATIEAKAKQLVARLEVDASVPTGVYTLQVTGTVEHKDKTLLAIARTQPLVDRVPTGRGPHGEPFELREDQRRLPPSLTDRIAVVVLPAAPFDFTLPDAEIILPRYVHNDFRIETTRKPEFGGPITFVARGGQLEEDRLVPPRILSKIPAATVENTAVTARLTSGVNTATTRHRVTITATAKQGQRTIHLTRTFELDTRVGFQPSAEPKKVELLAGEKAKIKLHANRLTPFDGPLTVKLSKVKGIQIPASINLAQGEKTVEITLETARDLKPGNYKVSLSGEAKIAKFAEQSGGGQIEITVKQLETTTGG